MTTEPAHGSDVWIDRVLQMTRFRAKSGTRAPYKPLLLLWLVGRLANGRGNAATFVEAEDEVGRLLSSHRVAVTPPSAANPFVYMASDAELWSVRTSDGDDIRAMPQRIRENSKFLREHATGRLAPRFAAALADHELRDHLVGELLRSEFPETLHEGILAEVGLAQHVRLASTPRDPKFQRIVPMA